MRRPGHKPNARLPYLSHIVPHTGLNHRVIERPGPRLPSSSVHMVFGCRGAFNREGGLRCFH
jgi:hypothetical protein